MFFLSPEINFFFGMFFLSPKHFFFWNRQQSNVRAGQKTKTKNACFFCNTRSKSNARAHKKKQEKTLWPYVIQNVFMDVNFYSFSQFITLLFDTIS